MGTDLEVKREALEINKEVFELEQRRGTALAASAFFPKELKNDVASAVVIYDLAERMKLSVMEISQSVFIIHGKPSFSTVFLVGRLNTSGYIEGVLHTKVSEDKQKAYSYAVDKASGKKVVGLVVTMAMAKAEGWIDKKGSKWVNMPELMLRKRAQAFFIREYYPQVAFGMSTQEELIDIAPGDVTNTRPQTTKAADMLNAAKQTDDEPVTVNEDGVTHDSNGVIIIDVPDMELNTEEKGK